MNLQEIQEMIENLKQKKGRAFLTATTAEDDVAEDLIAIGEAFGKAELLIQTALVRSVRLQSKGIEFKELPTKPTSKLGEGEPIGHPHVPSPSEPTPIGSYSAKLEITELTFSQVMQRMLDKIANGRETMSTLEDPGKTVCTSCGVEHTHRLEPDGTAECPKCGGTVKHWLGAITEDCV